MRVGRRSWSAEIEERRLHAGEDVPNLGQVDVACDRSGVFAGDVVLDEDRAFEDHHLGLSAVHPDEHLLAPGLDRDDHLVVDGPSCPGAR